MQHEHDRINLQLFADDSIRTLFTKMDKLQEHVTRLEVLMEESVFSWKRETKERLDRHGRRISALEEEIKEMNTVKKTTASNYLNAKNIIIALLSIIVMVMTIADHLGQ